MIFFRWVMWIYFQIVSDNSSEFGTKKFGTFKFGESDDT